MDTTEPGYYVPMLKALAAGNHLRIAMRNSLDQPRSYVTTRHSNPVKLTLGTTVESGDWLVYNEFHSDGLSNHTVRPVSAIVPELFISVQPGYWYDAEFVRSELQDDLIEIIAGMTGNTEKFIRGGMPKNSAGEQS